MQSNAGSPKADSSCKEPVTLLLFWVFLLLLLCRVFHFHSCILPFDFSRQTLEGPWWFVAGTDFSCVPITRVWNDLQHSTKPTGVGVSCRESCSHQRRVCRPRVSRVRHFFTVASGCHALKFAAEISACAVKWPQTLLSHWNCRVDVTVELTLRVHWGSRIGCTPCCFSSRENP